MDNRVTIPSYIGKNIKERRKDLQIKAKDLSDCLGITYQHLWQIESKGANITIHLLYSISKELDISAWQLLKTKYK